MSAVQEAPVISIVDDDESVRIATKNLVESLGYTAYTFASATEFLQSPRLHDTSCLISDVQMPNMSGIELQRQLIAQDRPTPIIFITAFPDDDACKCALDAGAICFLHKPFSGRTLSDWLDTALKTHQGKNPGG
jgi:FixJ family two-component response regulator